jgi:hypothetical protein
MSTTAALPACHESTHTTSAALSIMNLMIRSYWLQLHWNDAGSWSTYVWTPCHYGTVASLKCSEEKKNWTVLLEIQVPANLWPMHGPYALSNTDFLRQKDLLLHFRSTIDLISNNNNDVPLTHIIFVFWVFCQRIKIVVVCRLIVLTHWSRKLMI